MDYTELVLAVKNGDEKTINKKCAEAIPILKKYLVAKLDASNEDAEDAVQKMFEYVIPKIRKGEIHNPKALLSYMLTGVRHSYLKLLKNLNSDITDELEEVPVVQADQVWNLISEEQEEILLKCLEKLKTHYRKLMIFIFDHPNAESEDIAERFGISLNNAWIRKHRAVQQLGDCVKKYF